MTFPTASEVQSKIDVLTEKLDKELEAARDVATEKRKTIRGKYSGELSALDKLLQVVKPAND